MEFQAKPDKHCHVGTERSPHGSCCEVSSNRRRGHRCVVPTLVKIQIIQVHVRSCSTHLGLALTLLALTTLPVNFSLTLTFSLAPTLKPHPHPCTLALTL